MEGDRWEPWIPGDGREPFTADGMARLARYVSPDALARITSLTVRDQHDIRQLGPEALVEAVYERFLDWRRWYNREPWLVHPGAFAQRIRFPEWINHDSGTCLDFAVTFAASCVQNHLRPLLAVCLPDFDEGLEGHAIVLVDTVAKEGELSGLLQRIDPGQQSSVVMDVRAPRIADMVDECGGIAIDPTMSTRGRSVPYGDARARTLEWLRTAEHDVALVDVDAVLRHGAVAPYRAPTAEERPPIGTRLPPMPVYDDPDSDREVRADVLDRLSRCEVADRPTRGELLTWLTGPVSPGLVVLAGPQGVGKSRLAHRAIELRDDGCGWMLSAANPDTLMESLAEAELAETGGDLGSLTKADRDAFARAALARLRDARTPWAVVVDNATVPVPALLRWVPQPNPALRQQVVVTTTDDHRDAWQDARYCVVDVPPLTDDEVGRLLGDLDRKVSSLVDGRFLMVRALERFRRRTGRLPDPGSRQRSDGPGWLWSAVADDVGRSDPVLRAALVVSVLCPIPVPTEVVAALGIQAAVTDLVEYGICERSGRDVTIHRLFAEAVMSDMGPDRSAEAATDLLVEPTVLSLVQRRLEAEALDRLVRLVDDDEGAPERTGRALHAIGSIQELHGQTEKSATTYGRAEPLVKAAGLTVLLADCLFGQARLPNQQVKAGDLSSSDRERAKNARKRVKAALGQVHEAEQLHELALHDGLAAAVRSGPARCRALEALLQVKLAVAEPTLESRRAALSTALGMLEESERERREILASQDQDSFFGTTTELARSHFNLAGPRVELAKLESPAVARETLEQAWSVYETVHRIRLDKLELPANHPHLSACTYGFALVDYYRAILLTDASDEARSHWLREAERHAHDAVHSRQLLDGPLDGNDALKSCELQAKITLTRLAFEEHRAALQKRTSFADVAGLLRTFEAEARGSAGWGRSSAEESQPTGR